MAATEIKPSRAEELSKVGSKPWQVAYNGFSWAERCATNAPQRNGVKSGAITQPIECSVSGFSRPEALKGAGYIFMHLEDYRRPLDFLPVCKSVHASLHARFRDPVRWAKVVYERYVEGAWFTLLTMDPASQTAPFDEIYPNGLPGLGELNVEMAGEIGITKDYWNPDNWKD